MRFGVRQMGGGGVEGGWMWGGGETGVVMRAAVRGSADELLMSQIASPPARDFRSAKARRGACA